MDLAKIDMNLLVALDVLLEERSVSRAAARLFVTQPAMSQTLRRLRGLFGDVLLVRVKGGMEMTPRALYLQGVLRAALRQLRLALEGEPTFVPQTSRVHIRITALDYVMSALIPSFLRTLQQEAPLINVTILALKPQLAPMALESGEVDLALGVLPKLPLHLGSCVLYNEQFLSMVSKEHPLARGKITLERFVSYPQVLVTTTGEGEGAVDRVLRQLGVQRRVAVRIPSFLAVPSVLLGTELVATMPAQVVLQMAQYYPLFVFSPPLVLPSFSVEMAWPMRLEGAAEHRWVREKIVALVRGTLLSADQKKQAKSRAST